MIETSYSLVTLLLTFLIGFALGRVTAAVSDPRRRETARERRMASTVNAEDNVLRLAPEVHAEIEQLLTSGQKIEAIRVCRMALDLELKEAKDTVDRIDESLSRGARV
ncbi:ribosomal protein L7/L12 [Hyphomicrobium sp.]|uniref:ribosomal protein L7/L12 n=1 Tax=Hyphomicrobium sp. TaxID=82 RepID=UPI002E352AB6|nr:ribosomal protein L7/L12 [Hyphomicrobium sp.]HEX2842608.1 ribosomal protein L7/L12 [Hyphomicrobium sp.]